MPLADAALRTSSLVAASGLPLCPQARGATPQLNEMDVGRTQNGLAGDVSYTYRMPGSFNSHTYNVTSLLGRASFPHYTAKRLVVPPFQRPFSWEKAHVSAFWEDIVAFHEQLDRRGGQDTYFLGPLVVLPESQEVKLLDGQQRLATVTIFLACIRDLATELGGKDGGSLARDIQRDYLLLDDEKTFALTLGELDEEFFRSTIQDDPSAKKPVRLQSHRLIAQAKTFLLGKLRERVTAPNGGGIDELKAIRKTIATHMNLVAIEVASEDEAYLIFETLNDRGLRLAVPDLLLNYLMRTTSGEQAKRRVRNSWNTVVETLGTRRISTFVRHTWVSHYGDVKSQALFREIRSTLEKKKIQSVKFAAQCSDESRLYAGLFDRDTDIIPERAVSGVSALVHDLEADYVLPILLAGLSELTTTDFVKLVRVVLSLVIRHSVLTNRNPNDLESALYQASRDLRTAKSRSSRSAAALKAARDVLAKIDPSDEQIKVALREVYLSKRQASYVVYALAEHMQTSTKAVAIHKNSIEHVFPENPDKNAWPDHQALTPFTWHLGNLIVLEPTFNRDAGGKSFSAKRQYYEKSELVMPQELARRYSKWDVQNIVRRAEALYGTAIAVWPRI